MKFTAAGDAIIGRRIQPDFPGYEELTAFLLQGDARFFNLETTLNEPGVCFASQFSGGTYLRTVPAVLEDLKHFGFNMTSFNNNHAMDYAYDGFLATQDAVETSGLLQAGTGRSLQQAMMPRYLDTAAGRVALIAVNTTFDAPMMAGIEKEMVPGRPGIFGIRHQQVSLVSAEELECLRSIAARTGINVYRDIITAEGYANPDPEDTLRYGSEVFRRSDTPGLETTVHEGDMRRLEDTLQEAKAHADYVMLSVHSHEIHGAKKENVTPFLETLAHRAVDAGADAVVGHGPHLLRAIEVYKDKPIFYSLGDFILELYDIAYAPAEMYEKQGLDYTESVETLLRTRSKNYTIGLMADTRMNQSVLPCWEMENGKLTSLTLMPISLAMTGEKNEIGLPRWDKACPFFEDFAALCSTYGVTLKLGADGLIRCEWQAKKG